MTTHERVRWAASACVGGGIGWFALLMADVAAHGAIHDGGARYRVWEAGLILVQAALLIGAVGLAWAGLIRSGRLARIGFPILLLGRSAFVLGEVRSFIEAKDDAVLLPIGALLTAVSLTLIGIAAARSGPWTGRRRLLPLATGLYPIVAMFPIVAITGSPSNAAISFWGLFWTGLGIAMLAEAPHGERALHAPAVAPAA